MSPWKHELSTWKSCATNLWRNKLFENEVCALGFIASTTESSNFNGFQLISGIVLLKSERISEVVVKKLEIYSSKNSSSFPLNRLKSHDERNVPKLKWMKIHFKFRRARNARQILFRSYYRYKICRKFVNSPLWLFAGEGGRRCSEMVIRGKEESWQLVVDDLPERSLLRRLAVKPYADSSTPMARP